MNLSQPQPIPASPPKSSLSIFIIEDVPADADAIEAELREEFTQFQTTRMVTREDFLNALNQRIPDIVLSDFTLPSFDALEALRLLKNFDEDVPFILVTGTRSEEVAVECIRAGADDYILKASLKRLPTSIRNAIQRKAAERERKRAEQALRKLPQLIREAQESERRRVARDLHDGVVQILSSIKFRFQSVEAKLDPNNEAVQLEAARVAGLLDKAIREVRLISHNLLPSELYDLGLEAATRNLAQEFRERTNLTIDLQLLPIRQPLSNEVKLNLYRITQEGLTNIQRHAQAKNVLLSLGQNEAGIFLHLKDDGCGFRGGRLSQGMGLVDIRQRTASLGGSLQITSEPHQGTDMRVVFPITGKANDD